jgi:hypothetical protein
MKPTATMTQKGDSMCTVPFVIEGANISGSIEIAIADFHLSWLRA